MDTKIFVPDNTIEDKKVHAKFKLLQCSYELSGAKTILEGWAKNFIDRDGKLVKEFQTTFHSVFWELYIYAVLKEMQYSVDFSKEYPDFIVKTPKSFFIECVVSEIKQEGRPESDRNIDDILNILMPISTKQEFDELINEAVTRHSNSFHQKKKKYIEHYSQCEWGDKQAPYVIALGSYDQVNYGREYSESMLTLLYGLNFNPETSEYNKVTEIIKPGTNSPIPVGLFTNSQHSAVSAVIFSCTVTVGKLVSLSLSNGINPTQQHIVICIRHDSEDNQYKIQFVNESTPEYLSDGLFIFHNPYAKNPLPLEIFSRSNALQFTMCGNQLNVEGENAPIVRRLHTSNLLMPQEILHPFLRQVWLSYNNDFSI